VVAQSFSKIFGLYSERIGALHIATASANASARIKGALNRIQRAEFTTAPAYGAHIVSTILRDEDLHLKWFDDLKRMSKRINRMRHRLYEELLKLKTPGAWDHLLLEVT
jgi:aspartate aminotransferase, cytoplasmic